MRNDCSSSGSWAGDSRTLVWGHLRRDSTGQIASLDDTCSWYLKCGMIFSTLLHFVALGLFVASLNDCSFSAFVWRVVLFGYRPTRATRTVCRNVLSESMWGEWVGGIGVVNVRRGGYPFLQGSITNINAGLRQIPELYNYCGVFAERMTVSDVSTVRCLFLLFRLCCVVGNRCIGICSVWDPSFM